MPALTANASAYCRNRVHNVRLAATAGDSLTVNFAGMLGALETIAEAEWNSDSSSVVGLMSATYTDTGSTCVINCPRPGDAYVKCQAVTSDGRKLNQWFHVSIDGGAFDAGAEGGSSTVVAVPDGGGF